MYFIVNQITYHNIQMYTPYFRVICYIFLVSIFSKNLSPSQEIIIYTKFQTLILLSNLNLLMNFRFSHLRAAKVLTLFLITKFILIIF